MTGLTLHTRSPPGEAMTQYADTGGDPGSAGGSQRTVADRGPGCASTDRGTDGGMGGGGGGGGEAPATATGVEIADA